MKKNKVEKASGEKRNVFRSKASSMSGAFKEFWQTVRKVRVPGISEWWKSFWRVVLIVVFFAILLALIDYVLLQGTLRLQNFLPDFVESETFSYVYVGALVLTGILSAIGVLFQQGSSDGLTSMLGSGSQYQGSIAGAVRKISIFTLVVGALFVLLCLFSPMFLGGLY